MKKWYRFRRANFMSLFILLLLTEIGCTHDPYLPEDLKTICFDTEVFPVIETSCGINGCHSPVSGNEEFNAGSYETILQIVTPGDPRKSLLYQVISQPNNPQMMPPDRPLSKENRTLIELWILQGAQKTICPDTSAVQ